LGLGIHRWGVVLLHNLFFGGRIHCRNELLNAEILATLKEAQVIIEAGRREYDTTMPPNSQRVPSPTPEPARKVE
jgi:hypothetical protein